MSDLKTVGYEGAVSLELFTPENFAAGNDDEIVKSEGAYLRTLMERA